jgi:NAD+ synthase (glutamine-hydrolysing)
MRIALAQINTTVGAIARNADLAIATLERGHNAGADLVIFPELTLTGYPPLDLLDRPSFITHNIEALDRVAVATAGRPAAIVGFVHRDQSHEGTGLFNAAALCADGEVVAIRCKTLLPTYDVFDEMRYFDAAPENRVVEFGGLRLGISICEDIWNDGLFWGRLRRHRRYPVDPIERLAEENCDLLINISASPYTDGKRAIKHQMFATAARRHCVPLVQVNLVGGNDSLIFDGWSNVFSHEGAILTQARDFADSLLVWESGPTVAAARYARESRLRGGVEMPSAEAPVYPGTFEPVAADGIESICEALTLGIADYMGKTHFPSAVVGLSGGIDSAVTAALAVRAVGAKHVVGVSMPSQFSSQHSQDDAAALARNLDIEYHVVAIRPVYERYLETLAPVLAGRPFDTTEENLQARIRGNILMAMSNKFGHLVLSTGNKSEMAVGYCTLYGDMSGGLAVLADVPKTIVYELAHFLNRDGETIPRASIEKPPSAELRPDQLDSDSLPPYDVLDPIIRAYVEEGLYVDEIAARGFDPAVTERVVRMIERNEYKRRQAAIGLKITHRAFGYGRRMPVARGRDQE